ncbi:hypothetical protein LR48_Vigan10g005000 [Vigna angularis]|uniref:Uncharacterized protein n=1 Tax=Phaseolus angularis TaxID=3914 RepID=A0A0L9VGQ1_PHAAN|nr:hypothetical protein LR48_Vigan10g005000 [Vigna angularis]
MVARSRLQFGYGISVWISFLVGARSLRRSRNHGVQVAIWRCGVMVLSCEEDDEHWPWFLQVCARECSYNGHGGWRSLQLYGDLKSVSWWRWKSRKMLKMMMEDSRLWHSRSVLVTVVAISDDAGVG